MRRFFSLGAWLSGALAMFCWFEDVDLDGYPPGWLFGAPLLCGAGAWMSLLIARRGDAARTGAVWKAPEGETSADDVASGREPEPLAENVRDPISADSLAGAVQTLWGGLSLMLLLVVTGMGQPLGPPMGPRQLLTACILCLTLSAAAARFGVRGPMRLRTTAVASLIGAVLLSLLGMVLDAVSSDPDIGLLWPLFLTLLLGSVTVRAWRDLGDQRQE